jgi:hypothetical protein
MQLFTHLTVLILGGATKATPPVPSATAEPGVRRAKPSPMAAPLLKNPPQGLEGSV